MKPINVLVERRLTQLESMIETAQKNINRLEVDLKLNQDNLKVLIDEKNELERFLKKGKKNAKNNS